MNYTDRLSQCRLIAIYLGNTCNFDCSYCDRGYIENSIGSQAFSSSMVDHVENFFDQLYAESSLKIDYITFHGGEPFLYVRRMDQILERIQPYLDQHNIKALVTTNASMILENEWFLNKWQHYLGFTFSYDFVFQNENRDQIDVKQIVELCNRYGIKIMWQFVMPIYDQRLFDFDTVKDVLETVSSTPNKVINLIPLRHHRGQDKFKDFFDDVDHREFNHRFIQFINTLYNYEIQVLVDGSYDEIDKNYTGKHYKIILSPDGYIYPEYDFLEYQTKEFRVGQWFNQQQLSIPGSKLNFAPVFYSENRTDDDLILDSCRGCPVRADCGIKYLYKLFDREPSGACVSFYRIMSNAVKYASKLPTKRGFHSWVSNNMNETKIVESTKQNIIPDDPKEFKKYFLEFDHLNSAKQELTFSLMKRYNCYAGCEICYVDRHFEKDRTTFEPYIPKRIDSKIESQWENLFQNYSYVVTNDDMYYLKHNHPELFAWYQEHAAQFYLGSVTDNAFTRCHSIIVDDFNGARGIYEMTFSDRWLSKINFDKFLPQLDSLQNKSPIHVIKYIQTDVESRSWTNSARLFKWGKENSVTIRIHHDILTTDTVQFYTKDQITHFASYDQDLFTVLGESDFLQYDAFFHTQVKAIRTDSVPYDVIDDEFTITRHLQRHLLGKKQIYTEYHNKLQHSANRDNQRFTKYFKYIIDNLNVNKDYNFVPNVSVRPWEKTWQMLKAEGWMETPMGLLRPNHGDTVVPLFTLNNPI